jgi:hypothetical protein
MGIKISVMLIVFLLPALMSGALADIYVENATVTNFSMNITPVELNSSIDGVRSRIFTDDTDDAFAPNLIAAPSGLNSSINSVRFRIFTDDADDTFAPNLMAAPSGLTNSINTVRSRIFTDDADDTFAPNLISAPSGLDSSINSVRSRIFTDDADGLFHPQMLPYFPLPSVVSSPSSNQSSLPTDTDNNPLWGETARLNVTVTDDVGVASVTVDLSEIGGAQDAVMMNIGGNVYSAVTNASASTSPKLYNLTVNATNIFGNSNSSVSIQLKVMKNGDCTGNNIVNIGDALRLANNVSYPGNTVYALNSPYVCEVTGNGMINIGDALRLANNVSYPGNMDYILK